MRSPDRGCGALLPATSPALTPWVEVFGVREGDQVLFRIIGSDSAIIHERYDTLGNRYARWFGFSGFRGGTNWPRGLYTGEFSLTRRGIKGAQTGSIRTRTELR